MCNKRQWCDGRCGNFDPCFVIVCSYNDTKVEVVAPSALIQDFLNGVEERLVHQLMSAVPK